MSIVFNQVDLRVLYNQFFSSMSIFRILFKMRVFGQKETSQKNLFHFKFQFKQKHGIFFSSYFSIKILLILFFKIVFYQYRQCFSVLEIPAEISDFCMAAVIKPFLLVCFISAQLHVLNGQSDTSASTDGPPIAGHGSFFNFELAPLSYFVPFEQGYITVWKHLTKEEFFIRPLAYLLGDTARHRVNVLTDRDELRFDVLMISMEAKRAVKEYLWTIKFPNVRESDISLMPLEKIRIVWRSPHANSIEGFKLADRWVTNTKLTNVVSFLAVCRNEKNCREIQNRMKNNATMFNKLEIEFAVSGKKTSRKELTVKGEHFVNGKLFTELENMNRTLPDGTRYLNTRDVKRDYASKLHYHKC